MWKHDTDRYLHGNQLGLTIAYQVQTRFHELFTVRYETLRNPAVQPLDLRIPRGPSLCLRPSEKKIGEIPYHSRWLVPVPSIRRET